MYPDSLRLALLRVYEWASGRWHCFLGLDGRFSDGADSGPPIRGGEGCVTSEASDEGGAIASTTQIRHKRGVREAKSVTRELRKRPRISKRAGFEEQVGLRAP